jgi:cellulose synthase/poly-beta-1,6-N-acetylglucosamine synthase-like glycosyltransferase
MRVCGGIVNRRTAPARDILPEAQRFLLTPARFRWHVSGFRLDTLTIAYHLFILAGLLLALVGVIANVANFGGLREVAPPAPEDAPLVSVLIPARNEARCIGPCVASLLTQDYPNFELIMLDDHSEDGTGEIVRRIGLGVLGDRRVISGEALPAGWTGKGWACHQLSRAAKGHYLFFTDAIQRTRTARFRQPSRRRAKTARICSPHGRG